MSYTFINNCYNCGNKEVCKDYGKIQNAICEIHNENHIGYGKIEMICLKNMQNLSFGQAIVFMKTGFKVARKGWNGKGMFIYIQKGSVITKEKARNGILAEIEGDIKINSHIDMKTADGSIVIGWLASQTDMLSDDWVVVE